MFQFPREINLQYELFQLGYMTLLCVLHLLTDELYNTAG